LKSSAHLALIWQGLFDSLGKIDLAYYDIKNFRVIASQIVIFCYSWSYAWVSWVTDLVFIWESLCTVITLQRIYSKYIRMVLAIGC